LILRERSSSYLIVYQLLMSTTVGNRWEPFQSLSKVLIIKNESYQRSCEKMVVKSSCFAHEALCILLYIN